MAVITHPAQIGFEHRRIALDLGRQALGELLAEFHHDQPVGEAHDELHVVLDQQHRHALALQLAQQRGELLLLEIAQARSRLVEQQQRRVGRQRARDLDDALLAERQAAGRVVQMGARPQRSIARAASARVRASSARSSRNAAPITPARPRRYAPSATLSSTLIRGTSFTCWNVRPMPMRAISVRRATADRFAAEHDVAADVSGERAGNQVERRALAGAVGSDEAENLPGADRERQVVDGDQAAELLARGPDLEQRRRPPPAGRVAAAAAHPAPAAGRRAAAACAIHGHSPSRARCSSSDHQHAEHDDLEVAALAQRRAAGGPAAAAWRA